MKQGRLLKLTGSGAAAAGMARWYATLLWVDKTLAPL